MPNLPKNKQKIVTWSGAASGMGCAFRIVTCGSCPSCEEGLFCDLEGRRSENKYSTQKEAKQEAVKLITEKGA